MPDSSIQQDKELITKIDSLARSMNIFLRDDEIEQWAQLIQARDKAHTDELWLLEHGANMAGEKFSVHKYLEIRRKELES